jgi:hypothetical protein
MASERTDPEADRPGPGGTPEGHTPEKPSADEYGKPGTPAAGLSPEVPHAADAANARDVHESTEVHAADASHVDAGHEDESELLGPIDWRAWAASALGIAIAALMGLALALPTLTR